jgi:hypothetical protein
MVESDNDSIAHGLTEQTWQDNLFFTMRPASGVESSESLILIGDQEE